MRFCCAGVVASNVALFKCGALFISGDLHINNRRPSLFVSLLLFGVYESTRSYGEPSLVGKAGLWGARGDGMFIGELALTMF